MKAPRASSASSHSARDQRAAPLSQSLDPAPDLAATFALTVLDGACIGRGWQGTTLTGSLRGIRADLALWRPARRRKCIWEHVLHAAYWKYAIARALVDGELEPFPRAPSNWPALPAPADEKAWKHDRALLAHFHDVVRAATASIPPEMYFVRRAGRQWAPAQYIAGAAAHDAYHTGQIQLLKRLATETGISR